MIQASRADAKAKGEKTYFTGVACKHGHIANRLTVNGNCSVCLKIRYQAFRIANREAILQKNRANYLKNAEQYRRDAKEYRARNAEKVNAAVKKWKTNNRGYATFLQAERTLQKTKATPKWLTKEQRKQMKNVYLAAKRIRDETGAKVVVDHIAPINGKLVCGLNVPWNLCVRHHIDNSSKSNKITDDVYIPTQKYVLVARSALPWNLKKELP